MPAQSSFEDKRVRFCSQCNLNVYNLSGMTRQEAEALITKTEGRLCVRFYRRSDGSILTQNCPVGLKAIKRRVAWVAQVVIGMALSFVSGLGLYIFHLGTKPFPFPHTRHISPSAEVGVLIPTTDLQPKAATREMGRLMIKSREGGEVPHNKAKRQDQDQHLSQDE